MTSNQPNKAPHSRQRAAAYDLNVLLLEPYYTGSHKAWTDGLMAASQATIDLLALPGQFWKWRMQGGAVTLARQFEEGDYQPDLILASDMMDLSTFRALTRQKTAQTPSAIYFHENQLTYPQNRRQGHGWRYGFINYVSALAADAVFFNSQFHLDVFLDELPRMLKHFADYNELATIEAIRAKSSVLPLGLDLQRFDAHRTTRSDGPPLILWNHRWEPDKNPQLFLDAIQALAQEGHDFQVAILGENIRQTAPEFDHTRQLLGDKLVQFGYVESFAEYARWLWQADYVVSTSNQDFFGIAIAEAIYCGCIPILPDRLNYPHLIPDAMRADCLYQDDRLLGQLRYHLTQPPQLDQNALRKQIAQYDWAMMGPIYDAAFSRLLEQ
ncbi:MAG: glycosyl transferase family 1 [Anaerolineaceae bacterium]|nr:glycosyl transferase family 1 [Anaerolineaceae bacterium]